MRSSAYLLTGLLLILVQGVLFRLFGAFGDWEIFGRAVRPFLTGATPSLVLPMVVYAGVHEHSMARGSLLAYGLGWGLDLLGGGPAFLFRFTMVAIWGISRVASTRVTTQSFVMRIPLAFSASLVESAFVLTLLAIFGGDNQRPLDLSALVLPRAISTAISAPFVFKLAHRLSGEGWGGPSAPQAT